MHLNRDLKALVTPTTFCWNMFLQSNSYEIHVFSKDFFFFFSETEMIRVGLRWKSFFLEEKFSGV